MDTAAKRWLREYKKLFDEVSRLNAGNGAAEMLGNVVEKSNVTATTAPDKVIRRIGKIVDDSDNSPKTIKKIGRIVENAQKTPLTNINQEDMNISGREAIKYPKFTESDIEQSMEYIADMAPVKEISADKLEKTGKRPREIYEDYFKSLGNNIYSPIFGDIELSKASAKSEIRHGLTAEKIASIEAIPDVIQKGKVVFHKTKGDLTGTVDRIVVAAPIKIGNEDYYMGVMLQRDYHSQRLYLHNVVSIKAEEAKTTSQADSLTNWVYEEDSSLFITSILQNAINVKLNKEKNLGNNLKKTNPDGRSALKNDADLKSKVATAKAKAEARADKRIETEKAKLHAEYETDAVFNQTKVNKALGGVKAFAALPSKVRSELARGVWLDMSESDGAEWRRVVEIKHTVKICDEIMRNPDSGYDPSSVLDRRRLNDEISKALAEISQSGRKSLKVKLEGEMREEIRTEEEARRHIKGHAHKERVQGLFAVHYSV